MTHIAFVTGAGGCVGRQLVSVLLGNGADVTALVHPSERDRFPFREDHRVRQVISDLNTLDPNDIPIRATVYHLAAEVHSVPKTEAQRQRFFAVNRDGTARLAEACTSRSAAGFVFVSTIAVYGRALEDGVLCSEQQATEPVTVYGQSKLAGEHAVREILGASVPWVVVRPSVVYGPGDRGNFVRLVRSVMRGWFPVVSGGRARKNTLYVKNLATSLAYLGEHAREFAGRIFNVADPQPHSMRQLAEAVARVAKTKVRLISLPQALLWPIAWVGDVGGALLRREMPISSRRLRVMTTDSLIDTRHIHDALHNAVRFMTLDEGLADYLQSPDAPSRAAH